MRKARRRCFDPNLAWKLIRYGALIPLALGACFCANLQEPAVRKEMARSFFASDCGRCHDSDAQGDGPLHSSMIPPPANLTLVRHTRIMFLSILAEGIPGTAMKRASIDDSIAESVRQYVTDQPPDTSIQWDLPWKLENKIPDAESGSAIFVTACTGCHGVAGDGSGDWAEDARIWPKPANLQARSSDLGRIYSIISRGREGTMMPPQKERLSSEARWALAAYVYNFFNPESLAGIRSIKDTPETLKNMFSASDEDAVNAGEEGFDLYCASCHNGQAKGSFAAPPRL